MKGSFGDLYYLLVILLVTTITAVVCAMAMSSIESTGFFDMMPNGSTVTDGIDTSFQILDYGIPVSFIISCLFVVVAVYFIRSHPLLFAASLIILMVVVFVTANVVNVVINVLAADELVTYSNQFPITVTFIQNLPLIAFIFGCMIAVSMYAKPGGEGNI